METIQKLKDGKIVLQVDKTIYKHDAVLAAAYKFTDNCYIHVESRDTHNYTVYFRPKNNNKDLPSLVNAFCNELIDQQIRFNLDLSSRSIKELIIKKAFFPFKDNES